jgi:hypothetical protein
MLCPRRASTMMGWNNSVTRRPLIPWHSFRRVGHPWVSTISGYSSGLQEDLDCPQGFATHEARPLSVTRYPGGTARQCIPRQLPNEIICCWKSLLPNNGLGSHLCNSDHGEHLWNVIVPQRAHLSNFFEKLIVAELVKEFSALGEL